MSLDVGTSAVRIFDGKKYEEFPTIISRRGESEWVHFGQEALDVEGRTPEGIEVIHPMKKSVLVDFDSIVALFSHVFSNYSYSSVGCAVSNHCSEVEINALVEAIKASGVKDVYLFDMLTTIAASEILRDRKIVFVVDIGAGSTKFGVLNNFEVIKQDISFIAGDHFDESITSYLKNKYGLLISTRQARDVKEKVFAKKSPKKLEIRGQSTQGGKPKALQVNAHEIEESIKEQLLSLVHSIVTFFELLSPEVTSEIIENGILLTGGGSEITLIAQLLKKELRVKAMPAKESRRSVAGGIYYLVNDESLRNKFAIQNLLLK